MIRLYERFKKILNAQQSYLPVGYMEIDQLTADKWISDVRRLKQLAVELPKILSIEEGSFDSFYHLPLPLKEAFIDSIDSMDSCYRPDCVVTSEGLKILEFNIDPGSMMIQTGSGPRDLLLHYLKASKMDENVIISARKSFLADTQFSLLIKKLAQQKEILLWDIPRTGAALALRAELQSTLLQQGVQVRFIEGDEILQFKNSNSHFVFRMFSYPHLSSNTAMRELHSEASDLKFHNIGVKNLIFDSKINFAHMWNPLVRQKLNLDDITLINTYIPETYVLDHTLSNEVFTKVSENPEDWVLKIINGFQGNNVFLGSEIERSEWLNLLSKEKTSGNYILQKKQMVSTFPVKLVTGATITEWTGSHLLNLFYVDDEFAGFIFRFNDGSTAKIGAVNLRDTFALPVWINNETK